MNFSSKSFFDFIKSNPSLQLQANFEFRWPILFEENSFLIDTLEIPEIDSTQGYIYLDGYQLPVLGTPRFTNTIRVSFWAKEEFFNHYEILFKELLEQKLEQSSQSSDAFILPCKSTDEFLGYRSILPDSFINWAQGASQTKVLRLYNARLKQITSDEHNSSSQTLMHINLTLVFDFFKLEDNNFNRIASSTNGSIDETPDRIEQSNAESLASSI